MEKEVITSIEKLKCPLCKQAIKIEAEVKLPQQRILLRPLSPEWFKVPKAHYPHADQVYFEQPEPPVPEQHHIFVCRDGSGNDKTDILKGKFKKMIEDPPPDPPATPREWGESEIINETGIQASTEANVNSGLWQWWAMYDITKV
jgi:hypothetical protein